MVTPTSFLPDDLQHALSDRDLIVFDGECVLCSGFFRFVLRHDQKERFAFAVAQSKLGERLYHALNLPTDEYETNIVIIDGLIYQRLDAFCHAMRAIGGVWVALSVLRFLPGPIKDFLYHRIARNRYRIFGRYDTCMMPDPTLRTRFVDGGLAP
ncbi:thiol-disulfide oxidoreductase DCC family protein [Aliiroseovarius sp. YM-037]|uniref:thiol-disulfide oxidoreductase DCC family protein n=1 Tax=Aliiroseovarius sp. YM-037 TaxID=3341728 RepID=UPI003A7FEE97